MSTNQLITKLYDELIEYRGEIDNFTSFLRVCCLRYLSLMVDGAISADKRSPLAGAHVTANILQPSNNGTNMARIQSG
jgi:predicted DNA-binding ribbon-helix-helix protein